MIGDLDEDCVTYKELHDMMKAMTQLLTKNQVSTTTTSHSTTSYCILPSLPSYDGFDSNKHLCESNELPKTWNDLKILMRNFFVDSSPASNLNFEIHSLEEEEAIIASPIVHNILQEVKIKQEKEQKQVHFQKGEHYCLPKISSTMTLKPRTICFQEGENDEIMHMFAASGVYIEMSPWLTPFTMTGRQDYVAALKITLSRG
jgi:hypothetical protein